MDRTGSSIPRSDILETEWKEARRARSRVRKGEARARRCSKEESQVLGYFESCIVLRDLARETSVSTLKTAQGKTKRVKPIRKLHNMQ